ncbi:LLM class oxidoreductase [Gilvimarinus agarilyticus]|uniref:LLM class oxidoreductase n=1 Tax=Gilvimarinus sp. 2_MG-2023 TaxID=3062666 RepID=UPI001C08575F|nr:LLM class oxidoreductase [Gilvimarinus sp. 2_MG-2023]MBU2884593.1 LLM class oxidoreductase [Gilvimarinus agarilyticus]MDO6569702.1 LLM class oxidoreductase [Gilvimarinus sp. 2_MG-2023]
MNTFAPIAESFQTLNAAYTRVFRPSRLTLGLVAPLERYPDNPVPAMQAHIERTRLAEQLGFAALWLRDVPFNVPSFGDAGQVYDPFVYLGYLAAQTSDIALGVSSIVLPLRHPAHVAKAAASVDQLSGGRLLLGVASGDRPQEYPAMKIPFADRAERFRDALQYIQSAWHNPAEVNNRYGQLSPELELLPKPTAREVPLLITGSSQQAPEWIAQNGHGWMLYPRATDQQKIIIDAWRSRVKAAGGPAKPVMQPLYIDLAENPDAKPEAIHLGLHVGSRHLVERLHALQDIGINHVALNLRFNRAPIEATLEVLARDVLPEFPSVPLA